MEDTESPDVDEEIEGAGEDVEEEVEETTQDTEEEIEETTQDVEEEVEDTESPDIGEEIEEAAEDVEEEVEETTQDAEEEIEETTQDVEEAVEGAGEDIEDVFDDEDDESLAPIDIDDEQFVTDEEIRVNRIEIDEPGFIVIQRDNDGEPGAIIGFSELVEESQEDEMMITIDTTLATPTLYASFYTDEGEEGVFEETIDTFVSDDVEQFEVVVVTVNEELTTPEQIVIDAVTLQEPGWLVLHASDDPDHEDLDTPETVIASEFVDAGTTTDIILEVSVDPDDVGLLWITVHQDTESAETFEFDTSDDELDPILEIDDEQLILQIWPDEDDADMESDE
ncbi:MAG: hypothetical protein GYB66_02400 [Chloroflexi bacterium]|nr:hypothetical protein [Chloroflexota bacterium]